MRTTKFKVDMRCASCATNIDKKLKKLGCDSTSNPALRITKVKHDDSIKSDDIIKAIKEVGYDAKES